MKIKREVELSKEMAELGDGVVLFVGAVRTALADGFQVGQDLPAIVTAALANLLPAIDGANKIGDEFATERSAAILAATLTAAKLVDVFVKPAA